MPLAVYMIHGFVKNVPIDLEECACIDGAGKIRTYFSIVLPLLKPILTTVVVLDALATWNDIITNQLIVGGNTVAMNIQNALYMQFSAQTADWEHALPGIVMSMIPSLIFFINGLCHSIILKCRTIPAYQLAAVHTHFLQLSKFCINICIACKFDQNSNFHRFCSPSSIISYYTTYTTKISLLPRRQ